jgi:uncharacterized membrane protein YdjX (TVP38/TMEM64 family)
MSWLRSRRLWIVVGIVAALVALRASPLGSYLTVEWLAEQREWLAGVVARNAVLAALGFVALYVAVVALSLPGSTVLTLAGGMLFGAAVGGALAAGRRRSGAALVFLLARRIFGAEGLDRFGPRGALIAEGLRRNAFSYLLSLRLAPLFPFWLVNLCRPSAGSGCGSSC